MNRQALLDASHLKRKTVKTEAGDVLVQEITNAQRKEYIRFLDVGEDKLPHASVEKMVDLPALCAFFGALNDDGTRMFPNLADAKEVRFDVLNAIATGVLELSGLVNVEVPDTLPNEKEISTEPSPSSSDAQSGEWTPLVAQNTTDGSHNTTIRLSQPSE